MIRLISLTPGFSPVMFGKEDQNRFNGLSSGGKPLKRLVHSGSSVTRPKRGVDESHGLVSVFSATPKF